ncbi:MlaD family protein [Nocardioides sp. NPDC000445]|uniref:Phospholipid/cholesterol/gamma-HCH transport system substrate-binding protein n=1 Tax=Nocardioides panzhihuensis TaxID=860243 RepID=A0A7Z0DMR5_9ACTN|nr:MlaD family protein [Nocardioides panzhihuensis]NYI78255.1 phospholipid/cholesterol/gamma-HCH transport system substrate-binding protein [Nocardioides panzhihuensis]
MNEQGRLAAYWERIKTVPGLGRDVTALAVLMVLGVVAAAIIKSYLGGTTPWSDSTLVKAEFAEVPGLNPSAQTSVTMAGVRVGKVTTAKASDDGSAVVTMKLEGEYDVYRDARAVLRPNNPLNEMQVEINPGSPSAGRLQDGEAIPVSQTARPVQADEILEHLDERSQLALTDLLVESDVALARAPQNLPQGLGATNDTLQAVQPVAEALRTRREKIAALVSALSDISAAVGRNDERIGRLADATQATLAVLADSDQALRASLKELPGLTGDLRAALNSTQALTEELDPTLDNLRSASDTLPGSLKRFRSTVGNLGKTLDAAKPVLEKARPVVADLRPLVADVTTSLDDIEKITSPLRHDTRTVMSYLTALKAFVYNTSSVFGAGDANGGLIRGHLIVPLPGAGVLPNSPDQGRGEG